LFVKTLPILLHDVTVFASDPRNIFLYNGASPAVQNVLNLLIRNQKDGILTPIPQYPLYSASITLLGGTQVGYYLNEETGWELKMDELEKVYQQAVNQAICVRALVMINPGNPTGNILSQNNIKQIIQFCHKRQILLMADEVYQENVYIKDRISFISAKKVLSEMGPEYNNFELISFHSISKGIIGECGHRGGYLEAVNIDEDVKLQLFKLSAVNLCPNTVGQILVATMVNPPKVGEESYPLYQKETTEIYESLKRRALKLTNFLDALEGVSCNPAEGAMYAFPQIRLPAKAVEAAKEQGKKPDDFYCISMLDATGVCVVPGSGFGQRDGTFHFRTTFLPPENEIEGVMEKLATFHKGFMQQYQ